VEESHLLAFAYAALERLVQPRLFRLALLDGNRKAVYADAKM
jgi:hypothetical protein